MPKNKDFFHRITIIDGCLRRRDKKWYVEELLDCVNERLTKDYGKSISSRTLYGDLKYLQEEKDAPIEKIRDGNKVQIRYGDKNFSIRNIPLQDEELVKLKDALRILRQVSGLPLVDELDGIVTKLENTMANSLNQEHAIIQFEKHTMAPGSAYMDDLFTAIKEGIALEMGYQPFGKKTVQWIIHPYLLKEYRNRWFLIGRLGGETKMVTLALDRIKKIKPAKEAFISNDLLDLEQVYDNVIGVTLPEDETVTDILINVKPAQVPYVLTKPIHFSQEVMQEREDGSVQIKLRLINNYELRSVLLGYGASLEVLEPNKLREQIRAVFQQGSELYQ